MSTHCGLEAVVLRKIASLCIQTNSN